MNHAPKTNAIDTIAHDAPAMEKAVRTLTDLELMLAGGGDSPVNWGSDPGTPPPTGP